MRFIHSYGIIPLRNNDQWEVLLIKQRKGHWGFPKGKVDKTDENHKHTAQRELKEETGLDIVHFWQVPELTEHYRFREEGEDINKTVSYFLATVDGELHPQPAEVEEVKWVLLEEAHKHLTFAEARAICHEACKIVNRTAM